MGLLLSKNPHQATAEHCQPRCICLAAFTWMLAVFMAHLMLVSAHPVMFGDASPLLRGQGLVQDVYRSLVGPRAVRGLLRIRTSPEIRITKGYSPLAPVPEAQHLWQLPSCGQHAAVGFDFEYASSAGFSRSKTGRAVLQMAFQYSAFQPARQASGADAPASPQQVHG